MLVGFSSNELEVPPCGASHFLLLRQKKVSKEKATPGCAVGCANFPALLEEPGGLRNSPAAQTTQADSPRPFSVARRSTRGPKGEMAQAGFRKQVCYGQPEKKAKNKDEASHTPLPSQSPSFPRRRESRQPMDSPIQNYGITVSTRIVSPCPLRGAEQRRSAGGCRLALSEPQASFANRPAFRVAQGTGVAGTDPGVAFSLATFFWRSKRKYARASSAENTAKRSDQKPIPTPTLPLPQGIPSLRDIKGREPHPPFAQRDAVSAGNQGQKAKPIKHPTFTPPITIKTTRDNP